MNLIKDFFAFLLYAATVCGFAGCSDDEETPVDGTLLPGVWRQVAEYDGEDDEWYYDDFERYPNYMVLNADGTGARGLSSPAQISTYDRIVWRCEGNRFVFSRSDDSRESVWNVETLTQEELVFSVFCEEDGDRWVEKEYYVRIQ
ncbi:MAG: hypothetical protein K2K30_06285 [Alistipes sp.]|nr:hypothetical protein [Alistipes sp.]